MEGLKTNMGISKIFPTIETSIAATEKKKRGGITGTTKHSSRRAYQ